jgi:hypothetical protein
MHKVANLFEQAPSQWGLRGDPFLWQALLEKLGELPLPTNKQTLYSLLSRSFEEIIGYPLTHTEDIYVKQFAHGGMSTGNVSPRFWRETGIPLLLSRLPENETD